MPQQFDENKHRRATDGKFAVKGFSEASDGIDADLDIDFLDQEATSDFGAEPAAHWRPRPVERDADYDGNPDSITRLSEWDRRASSGDALEAMATLTAADLHEAAEEHHEGEPPSIQQLDKVLHANAEQVNAAIDRAAAMSDPDARWQIHNDLADDLISRARPSTPAARPHIDETPVQIDDQLWEIQQAHAKIENRIERQLHHVHTLAGDRKVWHSRSRASWGMSDEQAIQAAAQVAEKDTTYIGRDAREALESLHSARTKLAENATRATSLNAEFAARGGWSRAFLADAVGGHVHSSMDCSTCNRNGQPTSFHWATEYSGKGESQIVADAGYRACTVCFPSAPVGDESSLPTKMFTPREKEEAEARAKREAAKTAKRTAAIAKSPTATGEFTEVHDHLFSRPAAKTLKTERAAEMWWVDQWEPEEMNRNTPELKERYEAKRAELDHVAACLAEKRGVKADEVIEALRAKAVKKNGYRWGM